ncbi:MAG: N-acetyltransferase GCN5 [Elusimicrobia bacterium]|nr:MAG: N-acetyltransferase GCN5 [Elusimicrobiota bacterium]KAF0155061.1 MAG: N-acetyltransferase GCN5 [Elusimicrobiota bacterium]
MEIPDIEALFGNLPELETPRLLLRRFSPEDAQDVFDYASDPEVARNVTWEPHSGVEASRGFIEYTLRSYSERRTIELAVVLKETGRVIGSCGFVKWSPENARTEIGYAMSRKYWGKGLMTEAVAALMDYAFGSMKVHRLEARCLHDNAGSEKVMIKNGMKCEGTMRDCVFEKGRFKTLKVYSILEGEYRVRE